MMGYPVTFIPLLALAGDPLKGVLVWGSPGLAAALLAAALLGMGLNALYQAAAHDRRPHTHGSPPADRELPQAA